MVVPIWYRKMIYVQSLYATLLTASTPSRRWCLLVLRLLVLHLLRWALLVVLALGRAVLALRRTVLALGCAAVE